MVIMEKTTVERMHKEVAGFYLVCLSELHEKDMQIHVLPEMGDILPDRFQQYTL